eukprot:s562_g26.t1
MVLLRTLDLLEAVSLQIFGLTGLQLLVLVLLGRFLWSWTKHPILDHLAGYGGCGSVQLETQPLEIQRGASGATRKFDFQKEWASWPKKSIPCWDPATLEFLGEVPACGEAESCAMAAAKLEHLDLVQHQVGIVQHFREFWMEDYLCDVVLKSNDGADHRAHAAMLSAARQPVEIAASNAAVSALLDYIYGGQPEVSLQAGLELLQLAEAYDLPKLASVIETSFGACLDSNSALQVLQVLQGAHGLYALKLAAACEEKVAESFEICSQHPDFGKLSGLEGLDYLAQSFQ